MVPIRPLSSDWAIQNVRLNFLCFGFFLVCLCGVGLQFCWFWVLLGGFFVKILFISCYVPVKYSRVLKGK